MTAENRIKWCLLGACIIFSSSTFAEDVLLMRSVNHSSEGKRLRLNYIVSSQRAEKFPTDPLNKKIPLSFEDALRIASDSVIAQSESEQIELERGELQFANTRPRFYYWTFTFRYTPKGKEKKEFKSVIVLLDGSIVVPTVEELPDKNSANKAEVATP